MFIKQLNYPVSISILVVLLSIVSPHDGLTTIEFNGAKDIKIVEELIKAWSPLVWMAPDEKFMPSDVNEFLQHVHAEKSKSSSKYEGHEVDPLYFYDESNDELAALMQENRVWEHRNKRNFREKSYNIYDLPLGEKSENWFLVTNKEIDKLLKNKSSFVHGKDPSKNSVPIYAVVHMCSDRFAAPLYSDIENEIVPAPQKFEYNNPKNVYIPLINKFEPEVNVVAAAAASEKEPPTTLPPITNGVENDESENAIPIIRRKRMTPSIINELKVSDWKPAEQFSSPASPSMTATASKKTDVTGSNSKNSIPQFFVTYWMFYPYSQGKQMCTLSLGPLGYLPIPLIFGMCLGSRKEFGSHIGDWEHMTLYFNKSSIPEQMYVSAHDAGAYYSYDKLTETFEFQKQETRKGVLQRPTFPRTVVTSYNHPVLFAAQGSHGLWTAPGKHRFVRIPRLYDINGFGTPWTTWNNVEILYENDEYFDMPSWLNYRGRWGNPKSKCHPLRKIGLHFCEFSDGPTGIPLKPSHFTCSKS